MRSSIATTSTPSAIATTWKASPDDRLVGLMMLRDEDDVIGETLRTATQWFDRILVLDGTTDPERRARTDEILSACPEVVYVARDADVAPGRPVRDGARQFLLDEARRRFGVGQWIGLLHADEFIDQDPRPMLAAHNPLLDPVIRVRLVHAFLHTDDEHEWAEDPTSWLARPLRERVRHVMWPGVPESRFFFDRGTRDYDVEHHSKTVPTSFRAGPIEHGFCITQYNERSPIQAQDRGESRHASGWQNEHYARFLDDAPNPFVASLDTATAPFAPEFAGDPDGPFRVRNVDDVPAGPLPADRNLPPLPADVAELVARRQRAAVLAWQARELDHFPREFHALIDYTASILANRRVDLTGREQVAVEYSRRMTAYSRRHEAGDASR